MTNVQQSARERVLYLNAASNEKKLLLCTHFAPREGGEDVTLAGAVEQEYAKRKESYAKAQQAAAEFQPVKENFDERYMVHEHLKAAVGTVFTDPRAWFRILAHVRLEDLHNLVRRVKSGRNPSKA